MSFLKKLFGGGSAAPAAPGEAKPVKTLDYEGYSIRATPYQEGGQYQTCGVVSRVIDGETREHRFIRADRFGDIDSAADHAILKGKQLVDQMGDGMFK
ncbi:MAG: HlyU family transcriptional regulator [Hyphomicrobiales bacterium]|jgi:hypothetical protein